MRKWLNRSAVAAALILIVVLVLVYQLHAPVFSVGKPLPPGKARPQLVIPWDTAELLAPDGSIWTWGGTTGLQIPQRLGSGTDWSQVAGGPGYTIALKNDGSLWSWHNNWQVSYASKFTNYSIVPNRIGRETNWTRVCAGIMHFLALKNNGSLWSWGGNNNGQLGDGTTNDCSSPTRATTETGWRTITANMFSSFAIKSNGTIWVWGYGFGSNNLAPKQIGSDTNWLAIGASCFTLMALKSDGTLWQADIGVPDGPASTGNLTQIGLDRDWSEIFAGVNYFFVRKQDGSWWACGQNDSGQLGVNMSIPELSSPTLLDFNFEPWAFAPGNGTTLLLCKDGRLWTWGHRLGAGKPSMTQQKIEAILAPAVAFFPSLKFMTKLDIDRTPHLLWELPPEVRRSLGTGTNQ
jgi:hypothetical protein